MITFHILTEESIQCLLQIQHAGINNYETLPKSSCEIDQKIFESLYEYLHVTKYLLDWQLRSYSLAGNIKLIFIDISILHVISSHHY